MSHSPLHIHTPLLKSAPLSARHGKNIFLKLEALQPTGSFKIRGIGRLAHHYVDQGKSVFVSSSGGNAGVAVAYCGQQLGIPTTVFMPSSSHDLYGKMIKAFGASVIIEGEVWDDAHRAAKAFAEENNAAYFHPFDHPLLWQGHATLMQEVESAGCKPDVVVLAVGGGGLACGVLEGMRQLGWDDIPLLAVETQGADTLAQTLKQGGLITLDKITSKATTLGARQICSQLFTWTKQHKVISHVVLDAVAGDAAYQFANEHRIMVELSAGAALSVLYDSDVLQPYETVLVVVCGGVATSVELLTQYHQW